MLAREDNKPICWCCRWILDDIIDFKIEYDLVPDDEEVPERR